MRRSYQVRLRAMAVVITPARVARAMIRMIWPTVGSPQIPTPSTRVVTVARVIRGEPPE